jgi:hypothetical protein
MLKTIISLRPLSYLVFLCLVPIGRNGLILQIALHLPSPSSQPAALLTAQAELLRLRM